MDPEQVIEGLLDRLASHLRDVEDWDKYVDAVAERRDEISSESALLTSEQIAAMMFWRTHGLHVDENGGTTNEFDDGVEDDDGFILALTKWILDFEANDLEEMKKEGSFAFLADAVLGIYHIGLEAGGQTSVISVGTDGVIPKERERLQPLSDEQVDEILRHSSSD